MFVLLRDYLKKISKENTEQVEDIQDDVINESSEDMEEVFDEVSQEDLSSDNLVGDILKRNKEGAKQRKEIKKQFKKEKKERKKKKKKRKHLSLYSLFFFAVFFSVFISRILLLNSSNVYYLTGHINYDFSVNKYVINYDIEKLWNDNNLQVGDNVCTPKGHELNSPAVKKFNGPCISGVIKEAGNRVIIEYELPKYVDYEELKLYLNRQYLSDNIYRVGIKIKYFWGMYQITEISPIT